MSVSIHFSFTQAGQAAVFNAQKTGTSLALTHIQLGSGNKAPAGTELRLVAPQQAAAIAGGSQVTPTQIRMSALFGGATSFPVNEIGLWAGDPAMAGSILVAYWSQAAGTLAFKSAGVDFVFAHDMVLNAAVPAGSITILADQSQSAMLAALAAHEAKPDPHPQYLHRIAPWKDSVKAATTAALGATYANGAAGVGATLTAAAVGALTMDSVPLAAGDTVLVKNQTAQAQNGIYTVTTPGSATAAWVLTRSRFCDTAPGLAGAVTTVDQGTANGGLTFTNTFRTTDVVGTTACNWRELAMVGGHGHAISDIAGLSADLASRATVAALQGHASAADPHPQYTTDAEVLALIEARVGDYVVAAGTPTAVTVTLDPPITAYTAKTAFAFRAIAENTGAVTINAGGGIRPLVREDGKALVAGDILAGTVVTVVFDVGTNVFIVTSAVRSQVDERIALHEGKSDPHPQYRPRIYLGQIGDYRSAIVLLHKLDNTDISADFRFMGNVYWKRGNNLSQPIRARIASGKIYNRADASGHIDIAGVFGGVDTVACLVDGVKWLALRVAHIDAQGMVWVEGIWNETPRVIEYFQRNTAAVLNQEINDSITPVTLGAGIVFGGSVSAQKFVGTFEGPASNGAQAGAVWHFATATAPAGWLKANGAAVSRTSFAALFAAIGTTYGAGDGSTTFNLPDLRGEFVRGWDDGRGVDAERVMGSAQSAWLPSIPCAGWGMSGVSLGTAPAGRLIVGSGANEISETLESIRAAGGDRVLAASDTRPRNIALLACIKF